MKIKKYDSALENCKNRIKNMTDINKKKAMFFYGNLIIFYSIFILSIVIEIWSDKIKYSEAISVFISISSIYFLYIFSVSSWFPARYFYKRFIIFNAVISHDTELDRPLSNYRDMKLEPIWFLVVNLFNNLINSFTFILQVYTFFGDKEVLPEMLSVLIELLLIPSFVSVIETIIKKHNMVSDLLSHYFMRQVDGLTRLFDEYRFEKKGVVVFPEYDLKSKINIFFIDSSTYNEKLQKDVKHKNIEILNHYKILWEEFVNLHYHFKRFFISTDSKIGGHYKVPYKFRWIFVTYLYIMSDFLDV